MHAPEKSLTFDYINNTDMKRLLFATVLAMVLTAMPARAQYEAPLHEFSLGMGSVNISGMGIGMDLYMHENVDRSDMFGPLNLEYFYRLSNYKRGHVKIGVQVTYFFYGSAYHYNSAEESPDGYLAQRRTDNCISILPAAKINYVQTKYFDMYLGAAVGVTFRLDETVRGEEEFKHNNRIHPNAQLTFLGLEGGLPFLRFFLEAGFGEQGVAKIGLRYRM